MELALLALFALAGGLVRAERSQQGELIVSLDGGISPRKLPRFEPAPVAVHFSSSLRTADGSPLPIPRPTTPHRALASPGLVPCRALLFVQAPLPSRRGHRVNFHRTTPQIKERVLRAEAKR